MCHVTANDKRKTDKTWNKLSIQIFYILRRFICYILHVQLYSWLLWKHGSRSYLLVIVAFLLCIWKRADNFPMRLLTMAFIDFSHRCEQYWKPNWESCGAIFAPFSMAVAINKVVFHISTIDHYSLHNYTKGLLEVPCMLLILWKSYSQRPLKNLT